MAHTSSLETVNIIENNFSADSRDRDGRRVVSFEKKRAIHLHLFHAHIVQMEAVVDAKDAVERSVIMMTSGERFITARGAAEIAADIAKF
jgi:hypothetical protein